MPIPRRLIVIAASAAAAGAVLYVRNLQKKRQQEQRSAAGDKSESKGDTSPGSTTTPAGTDVPAGSLRELSQFLAGESWFDEIGWQGIWEREGIDSPEGWLKSKGKDVLATERTKLTEHPALLAGCRRRWIVVCRYAGIDVSDAAALWNATETAAA